MAISAQMAIMIRQKNGLVYDKVISLLQKNHKCSILVNLEIEKSLEAATHVLFLAQDFSIKVMVKNRNVTKN